MTIYTKSFSLSAILLAMVLLSLQQPAYGGGNHDHVDHHDHAEEKQPEKGPNNGKLFIANDVTLELAIFERGIPPEYRAWITDHGEAVDADKVKLQVQLIRLGGQIDTFNFSPKNDYLLGEGTVTEPHSFDVSISLTYQGKNHQWEFESHEGRVSIEDGIADKAGIRTGIAAPGTINQTVTLYGKTATEHSKISHIRARFPGQIVTVNADIGDKVKSGHILATIESNESLLRYDIKAPFDGTIIARHANPGEIALQQALFTLADYSQLWAELQAFPKQAQGMSLGQTVTLSSETQSTTSDIQHLIPNTEAKPYLLAGVPLDNSHGQWTPGMMVKGEVLIKQIKAPLVVDNRALQSFRDWTVVFIKIGDTYEIRPLELGRQDKQFTEVLGGLNPGDEYVIENSYLIKADIEKSGASHDH